LRRCAGLHPCLAILQLNLETDPELARRRAAAPPFPVTWRAILEERYLAYLAMDPEDRPVFEVRPFRAQEKLGRCW